MTKQKLFKDFKGTERRDGRWQDLSIPKVSTSLGRMEVKGK